MAKSAITSAAVESAPDLMIAVGAAIAVAGILIGLMVEGGRLSDICQLSAALIVFGGTLGAVVLTTPLAILRRAIARLRKDIFSEHAVHTSELMEEILRYAWAARRSGLPSLENAVPRIVDPFFRKAMALAVDDADPDTIRNILEL